MSHGFKIGDKVRSTHSLRYRNHPPKKMKRGKIGVVTNVYKNSDFMTVRFDYGHIVVDPDKLKKIK